MNKPREEEKEIDRIIEQKFTDQFFESTQGKNDIRIKEIKNTVIEVLENLLEQIAMLKKDKDTIYQWFDEALKVIRSNEKDL